MGNESHNSDAFAIDEVRELLKLVKENEIHELSIERGESRLRIKRGHAPVAPVMMQSPMPHMMQMQPSPTTGAAHAAAPAVAAEPVISGHTITSPMVGTYYATPSPENPPFVTVGSPIKADSVVCIIEAMKVMNEIQSEISGTVVECLVANGTSVEFGQPLFRVKVS